MEYLKSKIHIIIIALSLLGILGYIENPVSIILLTISIVYIYRAWESHKKRDNKKTRILIIDSIVSLILSYIFLVL